MQCFWILILMIKLSCAYWLGLMGKVWKATVLKGCRVVWLLFDEVFQTFSSVSRAAMMVLKSRLSTRKVRKLTPHIFYNTTKWFYKIIFIRLDVQFPKSNPQKGRTWKSFLLKISGQPKTSWEKLQMWVFRRFWAPWWTWFVVKKILVQSVENLMPLTVLNCSGYIR